MHSNKNYAVYSTHIKHHMQLLQGQLCIGCLMVTLYAECCYFWTHLMHADCSFNYYFLPYRPYWILCHQFWCQPIRLPEDNKSDSNRTGDSVGHLVSLNSIPPTWRSFVLLYKSSIQFIGEKSLDLCEILPFWVHKINCKKCYLLPGGKTYFSTSLKKAK